MAVVIREMQPLPFTKRELQGQNGMRIAIDMKSFGRDLAVYVGCGTFLALIDPYGATNHEEFFAEAVVTFFEKPVALASSTNSPSRKVHTLSVPLRCGFSTYATSF